MIDHSRFTVVQGAYHFAPKEAITDQVLLDVANRYEQQVMRKIAFLFPEQITQRFSGNAQVLETTKYDGEGVFIYFEKNKELFCFSPSSGRTRLGFGSLTALGKTLDSKAKKALLRAELYLPEQNGRRETVSDVIRVSFSTDAKDHARLRLALLDIVMLDGEDYQAKPFAETWQKLAELGGTDTSNSFHRAEGSLITESKVQEAFSLKTEQGHEGIVVRHLTRQETYKIKPRRTIDAVVIGYVEGELENGHGITSLLTALTYPGEGIPILQTLVRVGSGFTDEQRTQLLPLFEAKKIKSPITLTDSDGRVVNFVPPELIVEVNCEDVVDIGVGNKPNYMQVFSYDKEKGYIFLGLSPCPRPTFATFIQLREDKTLAAGGARLSQISTNGAPLFRKQTPSKPEIIRREVYAKGEMVRKLLVLKHEHEDVPFPYLVYWTDYSAKRKEPLKVDFMTALTPERTDALCKKLLEENIVKGWNLVE